MSIDKGKVAGVKGYKVFNPDWKCRGYQCEVGKTFEENVASICCERGFHFCKQLADCFSYYPFNTEYKTEESKIVLFNKTSDWTYSDWFASDAMRILATIPFKHRNWVSLVSMTDEKKEHHEHEVTGGFLRVYEMSDKIRQEWWNDLGGYEKSVIKSLPNFDAEIFEKITGIKVD